MRSTLQSGQMSCTLRVPSCRNIWLPGVPLKSDASNWCISIWVGGQAAHNQKHLQCREMYLSKRKAATNVGHPAPSAWHFFARPGLQRVPGAPGKLGALPGRTCHGHVQGLRLTLSKVGFREECLEFVQGASWPVG